MDVELATLLIKLLNRLDGIDEKLKKLADFEERIKKLEEVAHKQITEDDLLERYKKFVLPEIGKPPSPGFPWDKLPERPRIIPLTPDPHWKPFQAFCAVKPPFDDPCKTTLC